MASSEENVEIPMCQTATKIAMAGLVSALEKCDPNEALARYEILQTMKHISDNEQAGESSVFDSGIGLPNNWEDRFRIWTYVAVGGTTIIIKLAKWVISRKGRKAK